MSFFFFFLWFIFCEVTKSLKTASPNLWTLIFIISHFKSFINLRQLSRIRPLPPSPLHTPFTLPPCQQLQAKKRLVMLFIHKWGSTPRHVHGVQAFCWSATKMHMLKEKKNQAGMRKTHSIKSPVGSKSHCGLFHLITQTLSIKAVLFPNLTVNSAKCIGCNCSSSVFDSTVQSARSPV